MKIQYTLFCLGVLLINTCNSAWLYDVLQNSVPKLLSTTAGVIDTVAGMGTDIGTQAISSVKGAGQQLVHGTARVGSSVISGTADAGSQVFGTVKTSLSGVKPVSDLAGYLENGTKAAGKAGTQLMDGVGKLGSGTIGFAGDTINDVVTGTSGIARDGIDRFRRFVDNEYEQKKA